MWVWQLMELWQTFLSWHLQIFNGLAQGAQPLISESYGKGQPTQVKKTSEMEPARMSCCRITDPIDHLDFNRHADQHFQQ